MVTETPAAGAVERQRHARQAVVDHDHDAREGDRDAEPAQGGQAAAGEARGESPVETTMRTFLDDLVAEWRATRMANSTLRTEGWAA